ncbi:negative elongation factor A isoform X1 [Tribolium castaneum]|uniref:Negative elongation factor A-like Protein n=1 Tax=Tribolium castaneum TaxID=7070 RepID=D6X2R9_TRICA|nr:PREDICTED: negative elongation factor A isoform X1 [Tribolium castaneum]EFA10288.1 Negative elongation factor A-like Protein [Tribolium castaneum]|eukprot:XP_008197904.1 PREDICTED: negative elongation factor A isoform X1 [Tribolium castaneum]
MANVRDSDTSLWLHNKLGISNDSWTGGSICSQLNAEVLRNIKDCFPDLQTQVKLKLLLSFFHIPRRNLEEWKLELEQILDVAVADSELWVAMLAEALKTYPSTGSLNTEISDLDEVRPIFTDLVTDLRKLVRKQAENVMLPMECHYLNKSALVSVVGHKPEPTKHFTIKKKQKSAILRADLLQKSSDAASNLKKSSAPVIPVRSRGMPRKMTDTTPLKGIPSRVPTSGFRSGALNNNINNRPPLARPPAGRKEGGVKLLDIADQPLGYAAAKKRKKMQEIEDAKKNTENAALQSPPPVSGTTTTPDYAAGLSSTPAYAPPTPQPILAPTTASSILTTAVTAPVTTVTTAQVATPTVKLATVAATQLPTMRPVPPLLATTPSGQRTILTDQSVKAVGQVSNIAIAQRTTQATPTVTHIRIQPQTTSNALQRRGLALTREQMLEAQDMFRTANKVTRPEKALILGFMAGSRDNPCPHLGNIVTIKLSEDQENVLQPDDTYLTMVAETHFQMNYNNGEWKRIKKYKHIDNVVNQMPQNTPAPAVIGN